MGKSPQKVYTKKTHKNVGHTFVFFLALHFENVNI